MNSVSYTHLDVYKRQPDTSDYQNPTELTKLTLHLSLIHISCSFFTELQDVVIGHTIHPGIQRFVSFVSKFGLTRYQDQISDVMSACQIISSFWCTWCAQVKPHLLCTLLDGGGLLYSGHSIPSFRFINTGIGFMRPYYLRESVWHKGTRAHVPALTIGGLFFIVFVFYVYCGCQAVSYTHLDVYKRQIL